MTELPTHLSDDFSVVAFYGIQHTTSVAKDFFDRSLEWFKSLGFAPDKLGVAGLEENKDLSSFSRNFKKLQRSGFTNVTGFELYATTPGARVWWSDCYLSADYEGRRAGTHAFITARTSIASLEHVATIRIATDLVSLLRPAYGIGFTRLKKFGPGMYVIGVLKSPPGHVSTGKDYEEDVRICRWGDIGMPREVYRDGILRDVYPHNYLSKVHLQQNVGDISLEQWIRQDTSRGTLSPISENMLLWRVDAEQIETLRLTLRRMGVLFDWSRYT